MHFMIDESHSAVNQKLVWHRGNNIPFMCAMNSHTVNKLFNCAVQTDRPSQCWFLCLLQEDMGNRELCVIHLVEEHARERSEEGHCIPHEEEPITARSQAEGPVSRPGTDQLP